ncbi:oxidoreductase [Angustibacter aerolatus]|uniref:Oxidoreductase n=1 Tax=Angustibacter aerolatus TaxID=1162965 RepID=A0ABQ6JM08_9ACTN|nr:SDR family NAD(P)-dependent oxidoreductase [Angustibacter aerolatus]GMA89048.1 oxidoreductase [Angustibacter aerolatus]
MSAADLAGRVVVVTGAGGALGGLVCEQAARRGAAVELCDRTAPLAEEAAGRVAGVGGDATATVVDLLDADATARWGVDVVARRGRVDGLVHLVGGWRGGAPLAQADLADWDLLQQLLVRTLQTTSQAFHAALTASDDARLVIVSAKEAHRPTQKNAAYAAAKAAAEAWVQAIAHSWKDVPTAAAVTLVVTGLVTPQMRADRPDAAFTNLTDIDEVARAVTGLWDRPASDLNGARLWLTPEPSRT